MTGKTIVMIGVAVLLLAGGGLAAEVTNVAFQQRPGEQLVDITYDLTGDATQSAYVEVRYSLDGGTDGFAHRADSVGGDVGYPVDPGTGKQIVWTAEWDIPGAQVDNVTVEVYARAEITVYLPGDVPLAMVPIPVGSFEMGAADDPGWSFSWEQPVHMVTFAQPFYMGKYPVTQRQWQAVMGNNPSWFTNRPEAPVERVSWHDCQAFVTALNNHIANTGQGPATFRLPSEAEWEYACRAGTTTRFSFGDSDCSAMGDNPCNLSDYAWWKENDTSGGYPSGTKPVALKVPNAWGLYDMHGNVWELCEDDWHANYDGAPTDGSARVNEPRASRRVLRGGFWSSNAFKCRSAARKDMSDSNCYPGGGFRLARTEKPQGLHPGL